MSLREKGDYCLAVNPDESGDGEDFRETREFELENEIEEPDPGLTITDPAVDDETLSGEHTFLAEYVDEDETEDHINWAIRDETCSGTNYAGNVGGLSDAWDLTDGLFSTTVDMSEWESGEY